jgi:hypothetical protein
MAYGSYSMGNQGGHRSEPAHPSSLMWIYSLVTYCSSNLVFLWKQTEGLAQNYCNYIFFGNSLFCTFLFHVRWCIFCKNIEALSNIEINKIWVLKKYCISDKHRLLCKNMVTRLTIVLHYKYNFSKQFHSAKLLYVDLQ